MKIDNPIRVLVTDDHPSVRMGMVSLINNQLDMKVVAEAGNGTQAIERFRQEKPDITLMDIRLPDMSGIDATIEILREFPAARVIMLTTFDGDEDIYRALKAGAKSYLLKDMSMEEVLGTIRAVKLGQNPVSQVIATRLAQRVGRPNLSPRELEVLRLVIKGQSNKEIAQFMFITEDTVKGHLTALFSKLGVSDRTQAAIVAIKHGIVHLE